MSSRWVPYAGLCLFAACVLGTNLGGPRLWDRDEPRNAGCAAEMLARGDWIVPVFNAELRTHKPVLLYWLIMSSYQLLGINEWAARLPSAGLAIGTVWCTYVTGRRLFSPRVGLWAGVMLASSLAFVIAGRAATPDSTLIFCSTLALTLYVSAIFRPRDIESVEPSPPAWRAPGEYFPRNWLAAAAIYGVMGLAMLAKGPVGLVLPTAVIGLFLLIVSRTETQADGTASVWRRSLRQLQQVLSPRHFLATCWRMRPATALLVSLAVAAPWYVWVGLRTEGAFLRGFFWEHNLGRALQTMEGHRGNLLFYPLALLVGFFPWSVFAAPLTIDVVTRLRRADPWRIGYLFAASWIAVYVGLFSLAKTKLPSYVTPCFPALALLAGASLDRWLAGAGFAARRWQYGVYSVYALIGLVAAVAIPVAARAVLPGEEWLGVVGLLPVVAGLVCLWEVRRQYDHRAAWVFAGSAGLFVTLVFGLAADRVARHQQSDQLWAAIRQRGSAPHVAAFGCLEPSWVFYSGLPIDELSHESLGPTHKPYIERDGRWVPKPRISIDSLLSGPGEPYVITTGAQCERVRSLLPPDFEVLASVPFFLEEEQLLLLGSRAAPPVAQRPARAERRR